MAEQDSLDGVADATLREQQTKALGSSELEDIANGNGHENKGFFRKVLDYGIALGAVATSYSLIGVNALIAGGLTFLGEYVVQRKRKKALTSSQVRDSLLLSSLFTIPGTLAFNAMNAFISTGDMAGKALRAVAQFVGYGLPMTYLGSAVNYVVRMKTFDGVYEKGVKPIAWKFYKDSLLFFGLPNMLIAYNLPGATHYPLGLGLKFIRQLTVHQRVLDVLDPYDQYNGNGKKTVPEKKSQQQYTPQPALGGLR